MLCFNLKSFVLKIIKFLFDMLVMQKNDFITKIRFDEVS